MEWFANIFDWFDDPGRSNFAQWAVSVLALLVASLALSKSYAADRRLREAAQQARLRGFIERDGKAQWLIIANDGAATATHVSATINGRPLSEFVSPMARQADVIGPGNQARHPMKVTIDKPLPQRAMLRLEWRDESGTRRHGESALTY